MLALFRLAYPPRAGTEVESAKLPLPARRKDKNQKKTWSPSAISGKCGGDFGGGGGGSGDASAAIKTKQLGWHVQEPEEDVEETRRKTSLSARS